jgi:nicotinamidase/pyrazinamidase
MTRKITIGAADVLVVVDVQNDFCPGGNLPVPHGDEILTTINHLGTKFANVVLTQDWHPAGHLSFASSHPGKAAFDNVTLPYGTQVLWPDHCVQGKPGAAFHAALDIPHAGLVLRKGFRRGIDSYSAFHENDRTTSTGLAGYLHERGLTRVFVVGLALDFCVRYTAEDAASEGLDVTVIEDACRGIDLDGSMALTRESFAKRAIACVVADAFASA